MFGASTEQGSVADAAPITENLVTARLYRIGGRDWRLDSVEDHDALLKTVRTDHDLAHFPYGLSLWHSALGLSEYLCQNPQIVRGKPVLEIGAGVGLCGIIAQSLGADVTQTDYLPNLLTVAAHNAHLNHIEGIDHRIGDWRNWTDNRRFSVVLGADILYERSLHFDLFALFPRIVMSGGVLIIADPLRPQSIDFITACEQSDRWSVSLETQTVQWEKAEREAAIFILQTRQPSAGQDGMI